MIIKRFFENRLTTNSRIFSSIDSYFTALTLNIHQKKDYC